MNDFKAEKDLSKIKTTQKPSVQIEKISTKRNKMKIIGRLSVDGNLKNLILICIGRKYKKKYSTDNTNYKLINSSTYKKNQYLFTIELNFKDINNGEFFVADIYDLYLTINDDCSNMLRLGRPTFKAKHFFSQSIYKKSEKVMIVNPYYTFKKNNLSIEIEHYPQDIFRFLKRAIKWAWIIRLFLFPKNIWIIGERIYKAQDTGYVFFKYIREKYPKRNAFYVIDYNYPESRKIKELGNGLNYRSKKHILYTIGARRIISSHHPEYLYPSKMKSFKKKIKAKKIFLQHGIIGTKNMVSNYGNFENGFCVDEFIVSSDKEKEIVVNEFKYKSKHVHVTGLSRFDELFNNNTKVKRQLLIIPTWRDWITTAVDFTETEFYKRYTELISSKKLLNLSKKYQFSIVFCLHPNMQEYSQLFPNDIENNVKIVKQGDVSVQKLLKESCLMITDYSSVGFDFSFLNKPVIYYQFDREKFIGDKGSHINLDKELPGKICYELESLLELIKEYCDNNFKNPDQYKERSNKFIKYKDQSSCERIFKVVKNAKKSSDRIKNSLLFILMKKLYERIKAL